MTHKLKYLIQQTWVAMKPEFSNSFLKAAQVLRKNVPLLFYACFQNRQPLTVEEMYEDMSQVNHLIPCSFQGFQ